MIRVTHLIKELGRNLYRYPGTALASILSLTLLFLLFDLFWVAAESSDRFYNHLISEIRVELFVSESVEDSSIAMIEGGIKTVGGVQSVEYVSRDEARQRLSGLVGTDLLVGYDDDNPLPRSFLLTIGDRYLNKNALADLESKLIALEGVLEVSYSRIWIEKAEGTKSLLLQMGLALGLFIFATAMISSANNIRLMTRERAVGFQQLLLLGAGRIFVSLPFVIEGFLLSGLAASLGWIAIIYGATQVRFRQVEIVLPPNEQIIIFCLVVAVLGGISGYFGVRKLLKG